MCENSPKRLHSVTKVFYQTCMHECTTQEQHVYKAPLEYDFEATFCSPLMRMRANWPNPQARAEAEMNFPSNMSIQREGTQLQYKIGNIRLLPHCRMPTFCTLHMQFSFTIPSSTLEINFQPVSPFSFHAASCKEVPPKGESRSLSIKLSMFLVSHSSDWNGSSIHDYIVNRVCWQRNTSTFCIKALGCFDAWFESERRGFETLPWTCFIAASSSLGTMHWDIK